MWGRLQAGNGTLLGIGLILMSVALYALGNAFGKWLLLFLPIGQFFFIRSLSALVLVTPFCWRLGLEAILRPPRPRLLLLRVLINAIEATLFYLTAMALPLADTMIFWLASPIYVSAFSPLLLGERVEWQRWAAVLTGFAGVMIAMRPSMASVSWPTLFGLLGGILYASNVIITRSLRTTPPVVIVTWQVVTLGILSALSLPFLGQLANWPNASVAALLGLSTVLGLVLSATSLRLAPASTIAPYQNTSLIWSGLFGFLFFGEVPDLATIVGGTIIIGASLHIFLREQKAVRAGIAPGKPH